jgi:erythromycin esterase
VLHQLGGDELLVFPADPPAALLEPRGQRAIGVVYRPQLERYGNYVPTVLARRYDALLFVDETHALHPLSGGGGDGHVPETYPSGV